MVGVGSFVGGLGVEVEVGNVPESLGDLRVGVVTALPFPFPFGAMAKEVTRGGSEKAKK